MAEPNTPSSALESAFSWIISATPPPPTSQDRSSDRIVSGGSSVEVADAEEDLTPPPSPIIRGLNGSLCSVVYSPRSSLEMDRLHAAHLAALAAKRAATSASSSGSGSSTSSYQGPPPSYYSAEDEDGQVAPAGLTYCNYTVRPETEEEKRDRIEKEFDMLAREALIEYDGYLDGEFTKIGW